jgi:hypothetical protein
MMVGPADCSGLIDCLNDEHRTVYIYSLSVGPKPKPVTPRYANYAQAGESASIRMLI